MLVTPDPAPVSVPQEKVPFAQVSLPVVGSQLASPAPKSETSVIPPVDDAFTKLSVVAVAVVRLAFVAKRLVAVKTDDEALARVVLPVTSRVLERLSVVPVIAPRLAMVE